MERPATTSAVDHHRRPQSPPSTTTSAAKPPATTSTTKEMSSDFVPSTLPPQSSGYSEEEEEEVSSGFSEQECDEIGINAEGMDTTENSIHTVEEPKEGMIFNTQEEAYLYYSTYAKEKGFAVARRNSRKGIDGKVRHVCFECNRGGRHRRIQKAMFLGHKKVLQI